MQSSPLAKAPGIRLAQAPAAIPFRRAVQRQNPSPFGPDRAWCRLEIYAVLYFGWAGSCSLPRDDALSLPSMVTITLAPNTASRRLAIPTRGLRVPGEVRAASDHPGGIQPPWREIPPQAGVYTAVPGVKSAYAASSAATRGGRVPFLAWSRDSSASRASSASSHLSVFVANQTSRHRQAMLGLVS